MAAFPTMVAGLFERPVDSLEHALEIEEEFTFKVLLDEGGGHLASGKVAKFVGRRLIAQVSEYLKPDTCVRIDCDDAFLQGEVVGCWREGPATFVAVELLQALTGLEELAKFREKDWGSPQPLRLEVLQRA